MQYKYTAPMALFSTMSDEIEDDRCSVCGDDSTLSSYGICQLCLMDEEDMSDGEANQ